MPALVLDYGYVKFFQDIIWYMAACGKLLILSVRHSERQLACGQPVSTDTSRGLDVLCFSSFR